MKLGGAVLIAGGVAVIAGATAFLFLQRPDEGYRACVALMWDRKHPAEVLRRREEESRRQCEADRLRYGEEDCPCSEAEELELRQKLSHGHLVPPPPGLCTDYRPPIDYGFGANTCEHLSLEELRRADTDASSDQQ